jgi:hypothetical protein
MGLINCFTEADVDSIGVIHMCDALLYVSYDNLNYKQHLQVNYAYPVYPTGIDILLAGEHLPRPIWAKRTLLLQTLPSSQIIHHVFIGSESNS